MKKRMIVVSALSLVFTSVFLFFFNTNNAKQQVTDSTETQEEISYTELIDKKLQSLDKDTLHQLMLASNSASQEQLIDYLHKRKSGSKTKTINLQNLDEEIESLLDKLKEQKQTTSQKYVPFDLEKELSYKDKAKSKFLHDILNLSKKEILTILNKQKAFDKERKYLVKKYSNNETLLEKKLDLLSARESQWMVRRIGYEKFNKYMDWSIDELEARAEIEANKQSF